MNDGIPLTLGRSMWAIDPMCLPMLFEADRNRDRLASYWARYALSAQEPQEHKAEGRAGGAVAVIPLSGVLTPRMSMLSMLFGGGGGGLADFRDQFRAAVASPDVGSIVLDVDSPGGLIDLIPETADEVRAARGTKPIVAVSNTLAASAAYWIASQADEVVVTPSGSVGSIGVYMVHTDWSGANEKEGVKPTYISAGKYKVEGNPDSPLSAEARDDWQAEADALYGMFVEAVAEGRRTSTESVRSGYGQGRTAVATRALEAGLVDRVDTVENVVAGLLTGEPTAPMVVQTVQAANTATPFKITGSDGSIWIFDTTTGGFVTTNTSGSADVEPVEPPVEDPSSNSKPRPFELEFVD